MAKKNETYAAQSPFLCPPGYDCRHDHHGPNHGITTFDDIIFSMMTVFQW